MIKLCLRIALDLGLLVSTDVHFEKFADPMEYTSLHVCSLPKKAVFDARYNNGHSENGNKSAINSSSLGCLKRRAN
jgi:hypothetical protein